MQIKSLGYCTDLIFAAFDGEIMDRGDYLVIRTPTNPSFYWGNYLLFAEPPGVGDYQRWQSLFAEEIGTRPEVSHQTFGWDSGSGEHGEIAPFLENGFHIEESVVLTTQQLHPPEKKAEGLAIRPLRSNKEWAQCLENQVACRSPGFTESDFRVFARRQMERYQAMSQARLGTWFGAFLGDRLVADLGIFADKALGRYQMVQTHPDFRRQGIARRLVVEAGAYALEHFGLTRLVIVAEADSAAERLYRKAGFEVVERQIGMGRW